MDTIAEAFRVHKECFTNGETVDEEEAPEQLDVPTKEKSGDFATLSLCDGASSLSERTNMTQVCHILEKLSRTWKRLWIKGNMAKTIDKTDFLCYIPLTVDPDGTTKEKQMRNIRYAFLGLSGVMWCGCITSPDSLSANPDSTSTSTFASVNAGFEESDPDRRGCGEEKDTGDFYDEPEGEFDEVVWDTGMYDTGEVYLNQ